LRTQLFINNQWVSSDQTFDAINPATGEVITAVASAQKSHIDMAVEAAQNALEHPGWANISTAKRQQIMLEFAAKIDANAQDLAYIEGLDNGKSIGAAMYDVGFVATLMRYYAGKTIDGKAVPRNDQNNLVTTRYEPVGVCGLITPWNFPILMTAFKMAPMLASGSTGVFKPSELACLSTIKLAELWSQIDDVPPGVINICQGVGPEAGEALVDHLGVSKIGFTGSTAVAKRIMGRANVNMKRLNLEAGGKSPLIIFDDADLQKAAGTTFFAGFLNSGQFCGQPSRIFVHEKVHDQVVEMITGMTKAAVKLGAFDEEGVTHGPLISEPQMNKVLAFIAKGKEEGATLVTGGNRLDRPGYFVEPTIFTDVEDHMTIAREEIFGPVLSVFKFSDADEVIRRANDTPYGLTGSVFTSNMTTAQKVATGVKAGFMHVNTYFAIGPEVPFGGMKNSGFGRELGEDGLKNFLEAKTIVYDFN